jgi:polyisoprenoid-binding protein YceI
MMKIKKQIFYLLTSTIVALALVGCGALQEPAQPSAPLEAVPLQLDSQPATATEVPAQAEAYPVEETAVIPPPAPETAVDPYPVGEAAAPIGATTDSAYPAAADESTAARSDGRKIYAIDQANSEVRFTLDEDLRGQRVTVVGVTNQVAGELALDLNDLSATQVGTILINARTLVTDNDFRNRAMQNDILQTGAHEFITFTPTAVTGLPASASTGENITFNIEGDLTIRNITQPVVFVVTATAVSETQISGTATTTVSRADYDLRIPNVPSVANVDDAVVLTIEFTANAN